MIFVEYFLQQRTCVCFFPLVLTNWCYGRILSRPIFLEWDILSACDRLLRRSPAESPTTSRPSIFGNCETNVKKRSDEIWNLQPLLLLFFAAQYPETEPKFEAHFVLAVRQSRERAQKCQRFMMPPGKNTILLIEAPLKTVFKRWNLTTFSNNNIQASWLLPKMVPP